ncbi:MAG: ferritin-like domain-containing protein [Actinomycetota bacterium]|nr:ferritin-like domain-containing protein [Actinomycetota bacterium]
MADLEAREAKLIQYLNEAYGKEKELETALQAHIAMTTRDAYKKRLKDHLKETKAQAKGLQRRIKQLGGKAEAMPAPGPDVVQKAVGAGTSVANKAMSAAKGPMHALRGTGEQEMMLKNAKTEFFNEAEEIANYNAIETLAVAVGDKDTAKLAKEYRRQEERMSKFLDKTIGQLTKEVVKAEIPASQRKAGRSGGSRSRASSNGAKSSGSRASTSRASAARSSTSRASSKSSARASSKSSSGNSKSKSGSSRSRSSAKK